MSCQKSKTTTTTISAAICFLFFLRSSFGSNCIENCEKQATPSTCWSSNIAWYSINALYSFNQRVTVAAHIGAWKKQRSKPIFDPTRVAALLNRIAEWNEGPLNNDTVKDFFNLIINKTTEYEFDALDDPPKFNCSLYDECKKGYETDCNSSCSIDDSTLDCWRNNINVFTESLLLSSNQISILESRLNRSLSQEGRQSVNRTTIDQRIETILTANVGLPLPDNSVRQVFLKLFDYTLDFSETSSSESAPEFECKVSPECKSAARGLRPEWWTSVFLSLLLLLAGKWEYLSYVAS